MQAISVSELEGHGFSGGGSVWGWAFAPAALALLYAVIRGVFSYLTPVLDDLLWNLGFNGAYEVAFNITNWIPTLLTGAISILCCFKGLSAAKHFQLDGAPPNYFLAIPLAFLASIGGSYLLSGVFFQTYNLTAIIDEFSYGPSPRALPVITTLLGIPMMLFVTAAIQGGVVRNKQNARGNIFTAFLIGLIAVLLARLMDFSVMVFPLVNGYLPEGYGTYFQLSFIQATGAFILLFITTWFGRSLNTTLTAAIIPLIIFLIAPFVVVLVT